MGGHLPEYDYVRVLYVVGNPPHITFAFSIPKDVSEKLGLFDKYKRGERPRAFIRLVNDNTLEVMIK